MSIGETASALWEKGGGGLPDRVVGAAPLDADVAVFQRVFRPDLLPVLRSLKEQGVALVVDIDDDFMALGPQHPAFRVIHPSFSPTGRSWGVLREAIQLADVVTVSTPALARKYNGVVIRNCVPRAYLDIERTESHDTPVVGWTGMPMFHPGDLEVVGDAVAKVCATGSAGFRAIGDASTLTVLGVPGQQHQPGLLLENFDYARAVAQLDIGIVPLVDSAFNHAKSWLKGLEYAALGVPFVASIVPEYEALNYMGVGSLSGRPKQWYACLRGLIEHPDLRLEMAARGRVAASALTIEDAMAPAVWDAWTLAAERRVGQPRRQAILTG